MTEIRIVEYCGGNTFTEGWEKIYSIQPMQAFGSYDFAEDEVDDFVEVIEIDLSENEALDLDGDIVREFGGRLRAMIEGENDIGVLTIERKQRKIEEELKMTEKRFEVSTCFDGHEIEELQQYTEEELFEWGKDFANDNGKLLEKMEEASLEELYEELKRFENESYDDSLYRLWTVWNRFYDKYDEDATEEAEEAQEMFDRGMLEQYEWMLKNIILQKEDA